MGSFRTEEVFITYTEAERLCELFIDQPIGSFGWSIYDLCRKQVTPTRRWNGRYWRPGENRPEVFLDTEQADLVADTLKDAKIGTIDNHIYEKCRKRAFNQRAFISDSWRP